MNLVIVDTPAKAKILTDALGDGWRVEPCSGFVRDLPADTLGIDVDDDFRPTFTIVPGKGNRVRRLMKAIRESEAVYAATAPTRTGEAMAWHVLALSADAKDKPIYRVTLPALTSDAIRAAFAAPRPLDVRQVEAFLTARIIERLAGWSMSLHARKALGRQTALTYSSMVALRLLAEREQVIAAHAPETRWRASVTFETAGVAFPAPVFNAKGAPLTLRNSEQAKQLETLLDQGVYWVDGTGQALKTHPAPSEVTLPALIQAAERDLALPPERVLALVDTLYEAGWITHPNCAPLPETSETAQAYIRREYGTDYAVPDALVSSGIAPTDINRVPEDLPGDGMALYALIWKFFVAAHMPPAQERITGARILVGTASGTAYPLELRATATMLYADGWRRILPSTLKDTALPSLRQGDELHPAQINVDTVTGDPPERYTAASLIRALARFGTDEGAAVRALAALCAAEIMVAKDGHLTLTESGVTLAAYLTETFGNLTSPDYAAELNTELDRIASGERGRLDVLRAFWSCFGAALRPFSASPSHPAGEHKPVVLRPVEEV